MHRFYLPDLPQQPSSVSLPAGESAHASKVLRLRQGDEVMLLNGRGTRARARVGALAPNRVDLEVLQLDQEPARVIEITLFQAMLKPKRMDWLVEKVTELGVQRIQPTVTERVISRFSSAEAARKREKWQRTTIEALKQCGGAWLPSVQMPDTISHLLAQPGSPSTHVVASLTSGAGRVRDQLRTLPGRGLQQTPMTIGVWIGPEGDFTHEEAETLKNAGALPVTLGSNVLRGETAAICAISLVGHELDCLREPA